MYCNQLMSSSINIIKLFNFDYFGFFIIRLIFLRNKWNCRLFLFFFYRACLVTTQCVGLCNGCIRKEYLWIKKKKKMG